MYSNDKKSVILSSKRNTTYITPSSLQNENPFPVNHIASGNKLFFLSFSNKISKLTYKQEILFEMSSFFLENEKKREKSGNESSINEISLL